MKLSEEIIKSALLGTNKYLPQSISSQDLNSLTTKIEQQGEDKEDKFLKMAASVFLYEELGQEPLMIEKEVALCPAEQLPYTTKNLCSTLKVALLDNQSSLIDYIIFVCNKEKRVLLPEIVPLLLNKCLLNSKKCLPHIKACGELGAWLASLNSDWKKLYIPTQEENIWETGSFEARKDYLASLRKIKPTEARNLLETVISEENANNRVAFLEVLGENLSLEDEPFLMLIFSKDKSKNAKDIALNLLKKIDNSAISQKFLDYLLTAIEIKEERHLLISKKKVLKIKENAIPNNELFHFGMEKISSEKGVADLTFWIAQAISFTNPDKLAEELNVTTLELISLLLNSQEKNTFYFYIIAATIQSKNKIWAKYLLENYSTERIELVAILDKKEQNKFLHLFFKNNMPNVLNLIQDENYTNLDKHLSAQILDWLKSTPYSINQPQYQNLALYLPDESTTLLKSYLNNSTADDYQSNYFKNQVAEMLRILDIKQSILN